MNNYTVIIKVFAKEGEQDLSVSNVSREDLELLSPLIIEIRNHKGWFPHNMVGPERFPTAEELYCRFPALEILNSMVPEPLSGFNTIIFMKVFSEDPQEIVMV